MTAKLGSPVKRVYRFTKFAGADSETDPVELGRKAMSTGVLATPTVSNFYAYGAGSFIQKRPAITIYPASLVNKQLYDLVRAKVAFPLGVTGPTGILRSPDVLIGMYHGSTTAIFDPFNAMTPSKQLALTGNNDTIRYIQAGAYDVMPTNPDGVDPMYKIQWQTAWVLVRIQPIAQTGLRPFGIFHRGYMVLGGATNKFVTVGPQILSTQIDISDFNNMAWPFPPANNFNLPPEGDDETTGMYTDGEVAYFGTADKIYRLTGASMDSFKLVLISRAFGIAGMRAGAQVDPGVTLVVLTKRMKQDGSEAAFTPATQKPIAVSVGLLSGGEVKEIGGAIRTLAKNNSVDPTQKVHVQYSPDLNGAVILTDGTLGKQDNPALFWDKDAGGFWPWTLPGVSCMTELSGAVHVGMANQSGNGGLIGYLNPAVAKDDTTVVGGVVTATANIATYIETPPLPMGEEGNIVAVTVWASQTSGGAWTVQRRDTISGALEVATQQTFTPTATGIQANRVTFDGGIEANYTQQFRITAPNDGIGCIIHAIEYEFVPIGVR